MLSEVKIRNAKKRDRPYKIYDSEGLYVYVTPQGSKLWRMKYHFYGKEKVLSLGSYPDVSLKDVRKERDAKRELIKKGIDPIQKQNETFEAVSREWFEKFSHTWSAKHAETIMARLQRDVLPWLGHRPIAEIKAPELLQTLRRVEARAVETAHRIKIICSQVFRYGVACGKCESDPAASLKGALAPSIPKHFSAITDPKQLSVLLKSIEDYPYSLIVKSALKLQALLFCRPGELRHMEWTEVNLDDALWTIPAEKMKMGKDHLVPLSRQAIGILTELKPLTSPRGKYVFPSMRSPLRPMSENTVLVALRSMGYEKEQMSGHGFRAAARTILDEVLHVRTEYIELQLAHVLKDPNGQAYSRAKHLDERRRMMQKWSDYLDDLRTGVMEKAKVIEFPKRANQ